jgi:hypothetical protein
MRQEWQRESLERSPCCFLRKRVKDRKVKYRSERLLGTDDENRNRDDCSNDVSRAWCQPQDRSNAELPCVPELRTVCTVQDAPVSILWPYSTVHTDPFFVRQRTKGPQ